MNALRWMWRALRWNGYFPEETLASLRAEGLVLSDEGVPGWIVRRRYHDRWRKCFYHCEKMQGAIALTRHRLLIEGMWGVQLDVPLVDVRWQHVTVRVRKNRLELAFDASEFYDNASGQVELLLRTPHAEEFLETLLTSTGKGPEKK